MAPKIAYDSSSDSLLHPAKNTVFFQGWDADDFTRDDHGLLCAEMSRLAYASPDVIRQALSCIGFTPMGLFGGESLEERLKLAGTQGFVAHHPGLGLTVLAFRGTESSKIEDLLLDGKLLQQERRGCLVHEGFAKGWDGVHAQVTGKLAGHTGKLLVTGHSLGAAIATLAAIDTEPDSLIVFGSPLVGNDKLASLLPPRTKVRRYVNCCDLIARIPPEKLDGEHVRQLITELAQVKKLARLGAFFALKPPRFFAALVDAVRHRSHLDPQYKHVCEPDYADHTGTLREGISLEDIRKDQDAARRDYQKTASSAALRDLADHAPINYVSIFTGRL